MTMPLRTIKKFRTKNPDRQTSVPLKYKALSSGTYRCHTSKMIQNLTKRSGSIHNSIAISIFLETFQQTCQDSQLIEPSIGQRMYGHYLSYYL